MKQYAVRQGFTLSPEAKAALRKKAAQRGLSMSEFVRRALDHASKRDDAACSE